ncbi:MAG TPA: CPBP family intramembrane glutamic endopeptidase [Polyangiales bacterium]|jgi:membrane protease YdiL (CAAX protease family)
MVSVARSEHPTRVDEVAHYYLYACAITWLLAIPAAIAWLNHRSPSPPAIAAAGLSAFGPLLAALVVARKSRQLGALFGRWRSRPQWVALALLAPLTIHLLATLALAALGKHPAHWFHPPATAEAWAALVVFPLGEEFGWRGFAYAPLVRRLGPVRGNLVLGTGWGFWHLAYCITPEAAGFDGLSFAATMLELPLYSLLIAWVFEHANRSMLVAIAFHAGAHLDHIERERQAALELQALHLIVLAIAATFAARSLARAYQVSIGPSSSRDCT